MLSNRTLPLVDHACAHVVALANIGCELDSVVYRCLSSKITEHVPSVDGQNPALPIIRNIL